MLGQTQDHRHRVLVAAAKNIKSWFIKVRKIKAIYHTLNLFNLDVTQKCLIAECWVPVLDMEAIQLALRRGTVSFLYYNTVRESIMTCKFTSWVILQERSGSSVPPILNRMDTFEDPPTYNRTNKFTKAFQALVDAYGVANYREVNPGNYHCSLFFFFIYLDLVSKLSQCETFLSYYSSICHHHISFPFCCDVWGSWSWTYYVLVCTLHGSQGKASAS